ncbi:hypothetical protein JCM8097_002221 [Rhodosporidiobolus ruineniae]
MAALPLPVGGLPVPPLQAVDPPDPRVLPSRAESDAAPAPLDAPDSSRPNMGQSVSSTEHLVRLQHQLEQSTQSRSRASSLAGSMRSAAGDLPAPSADADIDGEDDHDEEDDALFMAARAGGRARTRSAGLEATTPVEAVGEGPFASLREPKKKGKVRPASSYIPASAWAGQLSHLAFPAKKGGGDARPSSSPSPSPPSSSSPSPTVTPSSLPVGFATPPRPRSGFQDPPLPSSTAKRRPTSASSLRHSLRLPFLPSIPASPLPPILSPGFTHSASSPPLLPPLETAGPLSPSLALTPPTASLQPSGAIWPAEEGAELPRRWSSLPPATRTTTSASAPNLSLLTAAPIEANSSSTTVSSTSFASASQDSPYFPPTPVLHSSPTLARSPSHSSLPPVPSPPVLDPTEAGVVLDPDVLEVDQEAALAAEVEAKAARERSVLEEKRYHALVELVETEKGYLEGLRVLVKVYFSTLPFLTILSVAEVHAVVRNAEQLLALHERIGERIEQVERELGWRKDAKGKGKEVDREEVDKQAARTRQAAGRIVEVLSDELPNFDLYNDFCARHAEALDITRSISSRQEWEAFERQCAARAASAAGRGDSTPVASSSRQNSSPFFPPLASAPPSSHSPLPFSASPAQSASATPSHSSSIVPTLSTLSASSASSSIGYTPSATSSASGSRSKLRFLDYAISPVQRITRYPLVLGQLAKYFSSTADVHEPIKRVWDGFKAVAAGVDLAKKQREGEMRTRVVAKRMEFHTPLVGGAFCDVLGPTLLVGALHVVHYHGGGAVGYPASVAPYGLGLSGASGAAGLGPVGGGNGAVAMSGAASGSSSGGGGELRVKYLGCFLYRTHLVMAKIKKRASYEPREWLPLRLFEISNVEDGQGLLTNSIRLSYRDHQFELGALCSSEKAVWLSQLRAAQAEAREAWDGQDLDEHGQPTLFDDTVVSSVSSPSPSSVPLPSMQQRKSHSRSQSNVSVASVFSAAATTSPQLGSDEPLPPLPAELASSLPSSVPGPPPMLASASPPTSYAPVMLPTPTLSSRSRFSTTASSLLLGRTPSSQRAAVDLRLGDVFSEALLSARAQAARDADDAAAANKRTRTVSGPKRSMTALTTAALPYAPYVVGAERAARMLAAGTVPANLGGAVIAAAGAGNRLERRRMSSVEIGQGASDRAEFRGAIGFDQSAAVVYRDEAGFAPLSSAAGTLPKRNNSTGGTSSALVAAAALNRSTSATPEKERGRWASAMRKKGGASGSLNGNSGSKQRPALPEIDTALAESMAKSNRRGAGPLSAGGSWSRRRHGSRADSGGDSAKLGGQLRRVASHNSFDAAGSSRLPHTPSSTNSALPTMLVQPNTPVAATPTASAPSTARTGPASDVERNNSVSSSSSSNETGTRSSSSHASRTAMVETPPSSIPPSPDFANVELDPLTAALACPPSSSAGSAVSRKPSFSTSPATPQRPTFAGPIALSSTSSSPRSMLDGMSSVFRLRRRKSTLGLVPPAVASLSPTASDEHLSAVPSRSPTLGSTPSREEILTLGGMAKDKDAASKALKLQRRASTTLSGLFSAKKRAQSSPSLAGSSGYFAGAASSPHLPLSTSPPHSESNSTSPSAYTSPVGSATTSPATSPPVSLPPTPGGGTVLDLPSVSDILPPQSAIAPASLATVKGRGSSGSGPDGSRTLKPRRGFFGMGMTPLS